MKIFAFFFALGFAKAAPSVESAYLEKLKSARDPAAITALRKDFEALRLDRLTCDAQLAEKQIPTACYRAVRKLAALKILTAGEAASRFAELDRACRTDARLALQRPLDELSGLLDDVTPECRDTVIKARNAVRYRENRASGAIFEDVRGL